MIYRLNLVVMNAEKTRLQCTRTYMKLLHTIKNVRFIFDFSRLINGMFYKVIFKSEFALRVPKKGVRILLWVITMCRVTENAVRQPQATTRYTIAASGPTGDATFINERRVIF